MIKSEQTTFMFFLDIGICAKIALVNTKLVTVTLFCCDFFPIFKILNTKVPLTFQSTL